MSLMYMVKKDSDQTHPEVKRSCAGIFGPYFIFSPLNIMFTIIFSILPFILYPINFVYCFVYVCLVCVMCDSS